MVERVDGGPPLCKVRISAEFAEPRNENTCCSPWGSPAKFRAVCFKGGLIQYFGHLVRRVDSLEKTLMLGGTGGQEEKGTTEDEMAGWHHRLDGNEFE